MAPSLWSLAAGTALWAATSVLGDVSLFRNLDEFSRAAEASKGFPSQKYRSSDIIGPVFQVNSWNRDLVDDEPYIFLGTVYGKNKAGPMILDARDLSLVYADQRYVNTYHSDVQYIDGKPYFTFWEGGHTRGHANGFCLVFDENYHLKYNVSAQGLRGALADMHEMSFSPEGNVIFSTYFNIPYNCSRVGGPDDALLMDSGFQEINPVTNEVVFDWSASKHFDIADSFASYSKAYGVGENSGFDFFHINSIRKTEDGNYLVSSRHMNMLTFIDGKTGKPIWNLGGKRNEFKDLSDGKATNFGWQHDARFYKNQSHITMFDNHGERTGLCKGDCKTRGLHIEIDAAQKTARLVQEYYHPKGLDSGAMGGFQALESGNVMLGFGYNPGFVEFTPDGKPVMDIQRGNLGAGFLSDMFAYRVSKGKWTGRPTWPPSVAIDAPRKTALDATVYVSWNGATDVAQWAILASNNASTINGWQNVVTMANRTGFETQIYLGWNHTDRYIGAAALTANGEILGSSFVIDMENGKPVMMQAGIDSVFPPEDKEPPAPSEEAPQQESPVSSSNNLGVAAGSIVAIALVFYVVRYFWRRRYSDAGEKGRYKRVDLEN
ncbi:ASST-domain-containing protein [Stachybotrys elegans]|uniref:ASST-domain-containing protein n=1 Tax=Stachybotrys elegans TaxID=80388 RepID=A0A8K0T0I1_9HYPO|nr:ASST-domain-containing protein [Stachybotrys elegans]